MEHGINRTRRQCTNDAVKLAEWKFADILFFVDPQRRTLRTNDPAIAASHLIFSGCIFIFHFMHRSYVILIEVDIVNTVSLFILRSAVSS